MKVSKVSSLYFSPTGGTKTIAENLASQLSNTEAENHDITVKSKQLTFSAGDVVVIAAPVFGGRIPAIMHDRLRAVTGGGAVAIILAVYGNRAYEDSLAELYKLCESRGFIVIAAGAFIARHSIVHELGMGRPNADDKRAISDFAKEISSKIEKAGKAEDLAGLKIPMPLSFVKYDGIPVKPSASKIKCGKCVKCATNCPVGAIPAKDPTKTDNKKCISCMRCISICPHYARSINPVVMLATKNRLKKVATTPKKPETFI